MSQLSRDIFLEHIGNDDENWECDCTRANPCQRLRAAAEIEKLEKVARQVIYDCDGNFASDALDELCALLGEPDGGNG